ncbi:MAG: DDE-type integrase/transposase/recombinase [Bacteroidales bacterium]|nr:DDE-type integrase/transposase/recombinase [Bacteroidales bacterium]
MENELILRKQAVELYLNDVPISEIAQKLDRSRQWVHKWITRYRTKGGKDWFHSESTSPKQVYNKSSPKEEDLVINVRKALKGRKYSQTGALSIMYEIERLGLKPPSIPTINRILKRNDLINYSSVKQKKGIEYPNHFTLVQQMDLVGPRYLTGGSRFYFQNIIDTENHHVGVYPIRDKRSLTIARTIVRFWTSYGIPDYLQMDNELAFRGSNRYPRSLGIVLRLALSQGVTPIFIPTAEPWRNGIIEKFNSNLYKYFFSVQKFTSFEDVEEKAPEFSDFHNQNHRYSTQGGKYPNQINSVSQEHKLGPINLEDPIPLVEGSVIFIRFIRSDRRLTILRTSFTVKQQLVYTYVIAEIVVDQHVLLIKQDGIIHHVFPFAMPVD